MEGKEPASFSRIVEEKIKSLKRETGELISNGQPDVAVKRVGRGLALQSRDPGLYHIRGEGYAAMGNYPLAIQNMKKALSLTKSENTAEIKSRLAFLHESYGEASYGNSEYHSALMNFKKASQIIPEERKYRLKCISCLYSMGSKEECLSLVEQELLTGPPTVDLMLTRAKLYLQFGKVTECYHDVETVLDMEEGNPDALELMKGLETRSRTARTQAVGFSLVGKNDEVIRKMTAVIQSDPHNPHHHILRGAAHRKVRSYSSAVDDFLLAMDKCSHQYDSEVYIQASRQLILTYNDFALECFKRGCYDDGVLLLNKAIKEEKSESGLYLNRGDCFFKLKEYQFALSDYVQAQCLLKDKPQSSELDYRLSVAHYTLGLRAFRENKMAAAGDHFSNAISSSPYTARFYTCRSRTRYELKDISGAKEDTLRSLLLDTSCGDALPLVARLFPGSSPSQLANSDEAQGLRASLIIREAPVDTDTDNNEMMEERKLVATATDRYVSDIVKRLGMESLSENKEQAVEEEKEVKETPEDEKCVIKEEDAPSPRSWAVLGYPSLTIDADTTLKTSSLSHSEQEKKFHSLVYYTKKSIKEEVASVLQSATSFPPRLKLRPAVT